MQKIFRKLSFTLVELIIVIAIVGILTSLAAVMLKKWIISTRQTGRLSDIANISNSLDMTFAEKGYFPDPDNISTVYYSGVELWKQGEYGEVVYKSVGKLKTLPLDPKTGSKYTYSKYKDKYQLATILEESEAYHYLEKVYAGKSYKAIVKGNYDQLMMSALTGGSYYIFTVPSLIISNITSDLSFEMGTDYNFVINGSDNLPPSYVDVVDSLAAGDTFAPVMLYTGDNLNQLAIAGSTGFNDLMESVIAAYEGSVVESVDSISTFISIGTGTADAQEYFTLALSDSGLAKISSIESTESGGTASCASSPSITNSVLYTGSASTVNQSWVYDSSSPYTSCSWKCDTGYVRNGPNNECTQCGNGSVDGGEDCDDGNQSSGDGCSSSCTNEIICGDGELETGEQCDDGNTTNDDGCSSICTLESNYDQYTTLMMHMDDASFTDSSISNFSVTNNGGVALSTSIYKFGTGSAYFDGSDDYLSILNDADLTFDGDNFTVDFWIYPTSQSSTTSPVSKLWDGSDWDWSIYWNGDYLRLQDSSNGQITDGGSISTNEWTHVAIVRFGNTVNIYTNGVAGTSYTYDSDFGNTADFLIGARQTASGLYAGYIDELRVSKGYARWTTAFDPPEIPYGVEAGCGNNYVETGEECDDGNTTSGDGCSSSCECEGIGGNTSETVLLIHSDTTNGSTTFTDVGNSVSSHTVDRYGDVIHSTSKAKFGNSSIYFDGVDDYLCVDYHADWLFGTDDFTIDMWVNPISTVQGNSVTGRMLSTNGYIGNGIDVQAGRESSLKFNAGAVGTYGFLTDSNIFNENTWYHVAVVRESGTMALIVDGEMRAESTVSKNITSTNDLCLGHHNVSYTANPEFKGYLDEIRVIKGSAYRSISGNSVGDTIFTPPTEEYSTE